MPGDKSITHRAVMLNAVAQGRAVIKGALIGEDCLSTCACMRTLGADIQIDGTTVIVRGIDTFEDNTRLNCGNSGTTIRLLTGLLAGKGITATLFGDESLSSRPMNRVAHPLSLLGADIRTTDGKAPISVYPSMLIGTNVNLAVSSAQVKSAILLAGISAQGKTSVTEPIKSRDHTEKMLAAMGADIHVENNTVTVGKSTLKAVDVDVPADISSAAYFMAIGALLGKTLCKNVGINPTRTGILKAFDKLGINYTLLNKRVSGGEEIADILVEKSCLRAIKLTTEDVPAMIDELPLVALLCAFADGESVITGAEELRVKESDRIATTTKLITRLGGNCVATPDGWVIRGKEKLSGGDVDSYLDHRIAMTATVGLMASQNGGNVINEQCCAISFPNFFNQLSFAK